jgi:D-alanine-D-alanine ligase
MNHKRVTVLRGGPSEEYEVSLKTGSAVLRSLATQYQSVDDVHITKKGEWLINGVVKTPDQILASSDVVFLALHGSYGEDGEVQKLIQRHNLPFTGSRALPSAIAFNKHLTKKTLENVGILMPKDELVASTDLSSLLDKVAEITSRLSAPYVIKPIASGSSVGVTLAMNVEELAEILTTSLDTYEQVLVEEYIQGREATCATLENFRDQSLYIFPAIEIIPPPGSRFFTTDAKYSGETQEICPGNFSYAERDHIAALTGLVHDTLGLSQYSRSDFIIRNGQAYFLEVNTLPGLTNESLFPKAAAAVGLTYDQLIAHLVETATR